MFMQAHSRAIMAFFTLALAGTHLGCGDDDTKQDENADMASAGKTGSAGKSGSSAGGSGGKAGSSSAGKSGSGSAGKAGSTAASGGSTGAATGGLTFTCTDMSAPKSVTCGGQTCEASTDFAMNPCIVPCCVNEGGKEMCGSKSTADMLMTECSLPVKPAPECADVDSQTGPLKGCCNTKQKKCGIISTLRPGCITESQLVTIPSATCGGETAEDAGVGPDAG